MQVQTPQKDYSCKITIIGSRGVGKTALTRQLVYNRFESTSSEGDYFLMPNFKVDGSAQTIEIEDFTSTKYDDQIREGKTFMLVYSVDSYESFEFLQIAYEIIQRTKQCFRPTVILVGNKCDLDSNQREVERSDARALAEKWECPFIETSAKEKLNARECFLQAIREYRKICPLKFSKNRRGKKLDSCTVM